MWVRCCCLKLTSAFLLRELSGREASTEPSWDRRARICCRVTGRSSNTALALPSIYNLWERQQTHKIITDEPLKSDVTEGKCAQFSLSIFSLPPHWGPAAAQQGCPQQTKSVLSLQHYPGWRVPAARKKKTHWLTKPKYIADYSNIHTKALYLMYKTPPLHHSPVWLTFSKG